jgi:hypothetical protein
LAANPLPPPGGAFDPIATVFPFWLLQVPLGETIATQPALLMFTVAVAELKVSVGSDVEKFAVGAEV